MDEEDRAALEEVNEREFFITSLARDVDDARRALQENPDHPFLRRTFVRTVFAEVEGLCAEALDMGRHRARGVEEDLYSDEERAALAGVPWVDDAGNARLGELRMGAKGRILFALSLVGRGAESLPEVDRAGPGWGDLCQAIKLRDRLMHPGTADDVRVSDEDIDRVKKGRAWFVGRYMARDAADEIVWNVVEKELPKLRSAMARLLAG